MHRHSLPPCPDSPFATGPYTDPADPSQVGPSHHHNHRSVQSLPLPAQQRHLTRRDIKVLAVIAFLLYGLGCLTGALGIGQDDKPPHNSMPVCERADGSTQHSCIYRSDGGEILNLDNGTYMYDLRNDTLTKLSDQGK